MIPDEMTPRQLTQAVVHHILIVEDDPESASFLKEILEQNRYSVSIAKDGGQAHAAFAMRKPDFVLLDLILPGVETGFEVCERFKLVEKSVPVLILSAIELDDSRDLAVRVGADGYLTKPFDPKELLELIPRIADRLWSAHHEVDPSTTGFVRFYCRCGKKIKVSAIHRGKTLTCPECGEILSVPRHD